MSSATHPTDFEQKGVRLSRGLISIPLRYGNNPSEVISLALALLEVNYNPALLSNDLWTSLTDEAEKILALSDFLSPVGAPFRRIFAVKGLTPRAPRNWDGVARQFRESKLLMKVLENWTSLFFYDMLVPMMAKGRTPTPSEGGSTARRKQMSLKKLLIQRDGWISPVGKMMDECAPPEVSPVRRGYGGVTLQAAHIVPFSANGHSLLRKMLAKFVGQDMEGLLTGESINDPSNALLLDALTHTAFGLFKFSVECQDDRYFFRKFAPNRKLPSEASRSVARPLPLLCNLRHAIGRVLWASGAAENIAKPLADEDELKDGHMEGDYWHRRELRALPGLDELAIDGQDDTEDLYTEERNRASSRHTIVT
ncbi:hypothetical protein POJ06DRAFT_235879 [Lipomyces tetrasporus]|uniref:HNH nuclease domain-containing protein n=1 Tax=Lipomyces tetrasporus TaxID=54092 RepID=A0AAD7QWU3_9ASCO|nr:uncharacterized protein POJ06DRAFT_235879 [Lipomyces tetrasporus]KAJ8102935.1 hypothetical protein POJ06DRAFT_235879 [Lipomyces tetrasporus]